jgi:hypothetical protein
MVRWGAAYEDFLATLNKKRKTGTGRDKVGKR